MLYISADFLNVRLSGRQLDSYLYLHSVCCSNFITPSGEPTVYHDVYSESGLVMLRSSLHHTFRTTEIAVLLGLNSFGLLFVCDSASKWKQNHPMSWIVLTSQVKDRAWPSIGKQILSFLHVVMNLSGLKSQQAHRWLQLFLCQQSWPVCFGSYSSNVANGTCGFRETPTGKPCQACRGWCWEVPSSWEVISKVTRGMLIFPK